MDDIADKISGLLNSPDGMEKLRNAAQSLLGNSGEKADGGLSGVAMPENIGGLMEAAKALSSGQNDPRVKLLLALKPHLSKERSERVDKAVRILQLVSMAPLLTGSGIL